MLYTQNPSILLMSTPRVRIWAIIVKNRIKCGETIRFDDVNLKKTSLDSTFL
jgi:hypothetical protein